MAQWIEKVQEEIKQQLRAKGIDPDKFPPEQENLLHYMEPITGFSFENYRRTVSAENLDDRARDKWDRQYDNAATRTTQFLKRLKSILDLNPERDYNPETETDKHVRAGRQNLLEFVKDYGSSVDVWFKKKGKYDKDWEGGIEFKKHPSKKYHYYGDTAGIFPALLIHFGKTSGNRGFKIAGKALKMTDERVRWMFSPNSIVEALEGCQLRQDIVAVVVGCTWEDIPNCVEAAMWKYGKKYIGTEDEETIKKSFTKAIRLLFVRALKKKVSSDLQTVEVMTKWYSQKFYTVSELCRLYGLKQRTLYDHAGNGQIEAFLAMFYPYRKTGLCMIPETELGKVKALRNREQKGNFANWLVGIQVMKGCRKWAARKLIQRMIQKGTVKKDFFYENSFDEEPFNEIYSRYRLRRAP